MTSHDENINYLSPVQGEESGRRSKSPARTVVIPENKVLNVLILGGGPVGLFAGYKLLKKGHQVTIFEKRKKYTRHNILSLRTARDLDTLSIIPSEIMAELNEHSSYASFIKDAGGKCIRKSNSVKNHLTLKTRIYYFVLNEFENAFEKHYTQSGGKLIRPTETESFTNITVNNEIISYTEKDKNYTLDMNDYDIQFINDGANSFYRDIYFEKTSYIEPIENNIYCYGLTDNGDNISLNVNCKGALKRVNMNPLSYGMVLIYNIENKTEFKEKFHSEEKLNRILNSTDSIELENVNDKFLNGMTVKDILTKNIDEQKNNPNYRKSQNLMRMFVSENYLYISIMVNPRDVGDYKPGDKITFDNLPDPVKTYVSFALYYYDLSELIDPRSDNTIIKLFPLFFNCVRQTCTFSENKNKVYLLCGDAMSSGNFHSGIVLNKNLVALNHVCQLIDEYIDSYPKTDCGLDERFVKLLFFNANLSNQHAIDDIIKISIDVLINYKALDNDKTVFTFQDILKELGDIILCKNCSSKDKLMCKNSVSFVNFLIENANNETLMRILKYLFLPDKYKYNEVVKELSKIDFDDHNNK